VRERERRRRESDGDKCERHKISMSVTHAYLRTHVHTYEHTHVRTQVLTHLYCSWKVSVARENILMRHIVMYRHAYAQ
jgi:hypothetical protein